EDATRDRSRDLPRTGRELRRRDRRAGRRDRDRALRVLPPRRTREGASRAARRCSRGLAMTKKQPTKRRARKPDEKKSEATRRHLLDRALVLFRERGVEATTMRDIAKAAGLSLGAAYYYFPSKEALVFAYYEANQDVMEKLAETATGTLRERLGILLHGKLRSIHDQRHMLGTIVQRLIDPGDPLSAFSAQSRAVRERAIAIFEQPLRDAGLPAEVAHLGA